jgi:hypothetical protein
MLYSLDRAASPEHNPFGGLPMKIRFLLGLVLLAAPLAAVNVTGSNTLVHIADGDQWTTSFAIVNLDTTEASYTLNFYANDGTPLTLNIVGIGSVSTVTRPLAVSGSDVLQTSGGPVLNQGWARLTSSQKVGAQAIFKYHVAGGADYEAAVPIDLASQSFTIAFDNSNGYFTGVAVVNTDNTNPAVVVATFHNATGEQIVTGTVATLPPLGHVSLLLNQSFPTTAGQTGTVFFTCVSFCSITGLGLRFDPSGPFTSTTAFTL